jgi:FAD synthetase
MVRIMATGVFDIIHPGHLFFLEEARKLGDELIVVVARDSTAKRIKRFPIFNENIRLKMVNSLKPVTMAILGGEGNIFDIIPMIRPDIIALGYDQHFNEDEIEKEAAIRGVKVKVVRIQEYKDIELNGTRKIIRYLKENYKEL